MVCAGRVQVGLLRQAFWAVVEPGSPVRTGKRGVRFDGSRCAVDGDGVHIELLVDELGLWDRFATLPWKAIETARVVMDAGPATIADLRRLREWQRRSAAAPRTGAAA